MSEQICQNCGKPLENCICGKEPNQVIRIVHEGLPQKLGDSSTDLSKEELKAKLEDRTETLKVIALRELEKKVETWASVVPDEGKRKAIVKSIMQSEDPLADFERKKEMLGLMRQALSIGGIGTKNPDDVETPPPAGDAKAYHPERNLLGTGIEQIDAIYNILGDPNSTDKDKKLARRKADELVQQFISGRQKAIKEDPQHKYHFAYTMCPKCGGTIRMSKGEKRAKECNHCGAILTRRLK